MTPLPFDEMTQTVTRPRLEALTSLRWFAALLVFGRHLGGLTDLGDKPLAEHLLPQGAVGVSFFFILSGFVLTWSRVGDQSSGRFYVRRFARIYPAYLVALGIGAIIAFTIGDGLSVRAIPSPLLLQAWVPTQSVYYAVSAVNWSLSVEAFFYLCFPFALTSLRRLRHDAQRLVLVACVAVPVLVAVILQPHPGTTRFWVLYIFPPVRLAEFVAGMLLATFVRSGRWPSVPVPVAVAVAASAYVACGFVPEHFMWAAVTLVPFLILIGSVAMADIAGRRSILHDTRLVWLGDASYAFYLVHGLAMFVITVEVGGGALPIAMMSMALALAGAAALHHAVELPAQRALLARFRSN